MIPDNERNIINLAKAARKSIRVPAELLPFFNQHGKWIGAPWVWSRSAILSTARIMRGFELPSRERVRSTNGTRVLLTSLELDQDIQTRWHEIHGNVLMDDCTCLFDESLWKTTRQVWVARQGSCTTSI